MDLLEAVKLFSTRDPVVAEKCWAVIEPHLRAFLGRYTAGKVRNPDTREDVISEAIIRIWGRRCELSFNSLPQWWFYVVKVARSCIFGTPKLPPIGGTDDIDQEAGDPPAQLPFLCYETIERCADEVWLGADPTLSRLQRRKKVAAGIALIRDRREPNSIEWLNAGHPDEIVRDPFVQKAVCYYSLHLDCDKLMASMLQPALTPEAVDKLAWSAQHESGPSSIDSWTWEELRILIYRFRNGLTSRKIDQMIPGLCPNLLEAVVKRGQALLPFGRIARHLQERFDQAGLNPCPITDQNLMKRLAFEYAYFDDLPQQHIFERTRPVADLGGVTFNEGLLNMWLSGGRLVAQLRSCKEINDLNGT